MAANLAHWPRRHYSLEEYFALERVGEARYEYWDGDIVCMSGGSLAHASIGGNVFLLLGNQLQGRPCRAFTSEMAVKTPLLPPYRYPDLSVVCGQATVEKIAGFDVLLNPIILIEVLSPGTQSLDRNQKRAAYQAIPSLMEYLLIAQDAPQVTQYVRKGRKWVRRDYGGLEAELELPALNCRLALRDIYSGVEFT